jgi:hypothetical protein
MVSYRAMAISSALRSGFRISTTLLGVALAASAAHSASQADFDAKMSHDGLARVPVKGISLAYVRPGATLAGYQRVKIDPVEVAFDKNWKPTRPGSRIPIGAADREEIRTGLAKLVRDQFVKELEAKGRYKVVNESGPDVLRLKPYVANLIVNAPAAISGGAPSHSFTMSAGEMTLFLELYDSESGQILARVVDRREGRSNQMATMATGVTNVAQAEDIARAWAIILRDAMDRAQGAAKK